MDLRPAKAGETPVSLVQQEAARVEPRLVLTLGDSCEIPQALFGMVMKRTVVHLQPCRLVLHNPKRPDRHGRALLDHG